MAIIIAASKLRDLLHSADPKGQMYVRILTANRLVLGTDPLEPTLAIDLSKETVGPYSPQQSTKSIEYVEPIGETRTAIRQSGEYWFELKGRRTKCRSLKELLSVGLRSFEETSAGTLEKLSHIKPKTKRIVAHDPQQLFEKGHLVEKSSQKLLNGWWIGTNNSADETEAWLRRAALCAGLEWGKDCRTNMTVTLEDIGL
jgi:hypothetical protein